MAGNSSVGGLLARRLALQCVQAGIGRRVRVHLEYRPNSALPESVGVWADGVPVPRPPLVRPVATRDAARSMAAELHGKDFLALTSGELARWGHLGSAGSWWELRRNSL